MPQPIAVSVQDAAIGFDNSLYKDFVFVDRVLVK